MIVWCNNIGRMGLQYTKHNKLTSMMIVWCFLCSDIARMGLQNKHARCRAMCWFGLSKSSFGEHKVCKIIPTILKCWFSGMLWSFVTSLCLPNEDFGNRNKRWEPHFRGPLSGVWVIDLGDEPLKSQSKIRISSFVHPSKIVFRSSFQRVMDQIEYSHKSDLLFSLPKDRPPGLKWAKCYMLCFVFIMLYNVVTCASVMADE